MSNESMNMENINNNFVGDVLFNNTKVAAYHLWTLSKNVNTVDLWYCAEDVALYFDKNNILDSADVRNILEQGLDDPGYVYFVRNIAYRLYIYTKNVDSIKNWTDAESLIRNRQWTDALIIMANTMRNSEDVPSVVSTWVKNHYKSF